MSNPIAVVAEASADFEAAAILIDRTIVTKAEWTSENINSHRRYVGRNDAEKYVKWQQIEAERGKDWRRTVRSRFGQDLPRHEISLRIQRVIFEFTIQSSDTDRPMPFVVIVKDTDADDDALAALQDARAKYLDVVIGVEHTELECWLIAGFTPQNTTEESRLAEICRGEGAGVGFDPCAYSERLTATGKDDHKLSPKRVLKHLTDDNRSRAVDGLRLTPVQLLKDRGKGNGLADFLTDIEQRLVRIVFGV